MSVGLVGPVVGRVNGTLEASISSLPENMLQKILEGLSRETLQDTSLVSQLWSRVTFLAIREREKAKTLFFASQAFVVSLLPRLNKIVQQEGFFDSYNDAKSLKALRATAKCTRDAFGLALATMSVEEIDRFELFTEHLPHPPLLGDFVSAAREQKVQEEEWNQLKARLNALREE